MAHCDIHNIDYEQEEKQLFGKPMLVGFCPKCEEEDEKRVNEKIARDKARETLERMHSCNIEPMYYDVSLETFTANSPEQEKAKSAIETMIAEKSGKIVMLGKNGTGKTHLAVCAVKAIGGKIFTMYEISTRIRASYTSNARETELEIVDELANLKLLVIDEIGRTKGSDAETNWLSYIIDKRHTRNLPLILISNKHTKKQCAEKDGCPNCLENYISEDIMSRLNEDGKLIYFTGEDYRKIKRQNARSHVTIPEGDNA